MAIRFAGNTTTLSDSLMQYCLACLELGMPEHVIKVINRFSGLCQNQPRFIYQRGLANLSAGNFRQCWSDYEARFDAGCSSLPEIQIPRWDGERSKSQENILIVCEQGFGDILQFLRFMPWIRKVFPVVGILAPTATLSSS